MCTAMRGVVLLFLLSLWPGGNVDAINDDVLAKVVQQMRGFTFDRNQYAMAVILTQDQCNGKKEVNFCLIRLEVQNTVNGHNVYTGTRLIAATPHNGVHAEYRLLSGGKISPMQTLIKKAVNNAGDCIVFFSTYSPCLEKCNKPNGPNNILPFMTVFNGFANDHKAFVFSSVWDPARNHPGVTNPPRQDVLESFRRIEQHIPLYRCVRIKQKNRLVNRCYRCVTDPNPLTNKCLNGY